jgi:hypothetical protein
LASASGAHEALEPWVGGFLATLVDGEGLMRGVDRPRRRAG